MAVKKNIRKYIIVGLIICILYTIFASTPLSKEHQFTQLWNMEIDISNIEENAKAENYFILGQNLGYFSNDGKLCSLLSFPFRATVSNSSYTTYTTNNNSLKIFSPIGEELFSINESGFPLINENNVFVFLPGGTSFARYVGETKKYEYNGVIPISAFQSADNTCVLGFADGKICVIAEDGTPSFQFFPGGSDYPIILGLALSPDKTMIASVSGQNPQRFVLTQYDASQSKVIFNHTVDKSDTRQRLVSFSRDNTTVYYDTKDAFFVVDAKLGKQTSIPIKSQVLSFQENDSLVFLLAKNQNIYTVYVIEKPSTLCAEFSFSARNAFLKVKGDTLFVGKDSSISCIKLNQN